MKFEGIDILEQAKATSVQEEAMTDVIEKDMANFKRLMDEAFSDSPLGTKPSPMYVYSQIEEAFLKKDSHCLFYEDQMDGKQTLREEEFSEPSLSAAFALFTPTFSSFTGENKIASSNTLSSSTLDAIAAFDRICTEMMVMTTQEVTETTLVLNHPSYRDSDFFGAEVTISEFSTAPKVFNVRITASPQAVILLESAARTFLESFQERKFPFTINRIDTEVGSSSRFAFSRKEKTSNDFEDDSQGKNDS